MLLKDGLTGTESSLNDILLKDGLDRSQRDLTSCNHEYLYDRCEIEDDGPERQIALGVTINPMIKYIYKCKFCGNEFFRKEEISNVCCCQK